MSRPYVMALKVNNKTDNDMKPLGTAFYDKDGDVQQQPTIIKAQSTGNGGVLEKVGGSDGLFGLVAYTCPDTTRILVIYTTMPAKTGSENHCWVGTVTSNTPVNPKLAEDCYNGPPSGFSETQATWEFSQEGKQFAYVMTPTVDNKKGYNTFSTIVLNIYSK